VLISYANILLKQAFSVNQTGMREKIKNENVEEISPFRSLKDGGLM